MIKACDEFTLPDSPRWRAIACLLSHRRQTSLPPAPPCQGQGFVLLRHGIRDLAGWAYLTRKQGQKTCLFGGEQKGFVRRRYYARLFYACTYSV